MYRKLEFLARNFRQLHLLRCHGLATGLSAKNHHSPMFGSFNPGRSPGGGALTGTAPCRPLQLEGVIPCGYFRG